MPNVRSGYLKQGDMVGIHLTDSGKQKANRNEIWVLVSQTNLRETAEATDAIRMKLTIESPAVLFPVPQDGQWFVKPHDAAVKVPDDIELQFIEK